MSKEKPEAKTKPLYDVRRVHIGKNAYVQELSHECGELYSRTLVFFWRTVRRKLLIQSKQKQLRKIKHQIKDVEHKQSRALISTLEAEGVQRLVIGDVRDIRQELDVGRTTNQKVHQWSFGSIRHKLTYKAQRVGMHVALQEESYSSRTCPMCDHRRKRN